MRWTGGTGSPNRVAFLREFSPAIREKQGKYRAGTGLPFENLTLIIYLCLKLDG
jgi:hypothetical protein